MKKVLFWVWSTIRDISEWSAMVAVLIVILSVSLAVYCGVLLMFLKFLGVQCGGNK
jgi:apolipoprotein N-acyltransferase